MGIIDPMMFQYFDRIGLKIDIRDWYMLIDFVGLTGKQTWMDGSGLSSSIALDGF